MQKKHRDIIAIPTGSMADIAFLLLIFFLVTTTIRDERGIMVKLPAWNPNAPVTHVNERNVLNIYINASNELMVENEFISIDELKNFIKAFITNPTQSEKMPASTKQAIITLKNDRGTSYTQYLRVYDEIKSTYKELNDEKAHELFASTFDQCTGAQKIVIRRAFPVVISEMEESNFQNK
ncbi:MAG: biopolymer transporter ExbD [Saprospiraceae bacterium]|nr:biopolymer transporter ExbD [Saprospiraceae bacterium]